MIWFGAIAPDPGPRARRPPDSVVVTVAGSTGALPGTGAATVKVTPYLEYPPKGRATGGVRCHRFLKGEDALVLAWAGPGPARGATDAGVPVDLPAPDGRRDGSGTRVRQPLAALGGWPPRPEPAPLQPAQQGASVARARGSGQGGDQVLRAGLRHVAVLPPAGDRDAAGPGVEDLPAEAAAAGQQGQRPVVVR